MTIWFLDCGNGCVTKVNLSKEREEELKQMLGRKCDAYDFIFMYSDEFGINPDSSSWMVTDNDCVYDVEF